MTTAIVCASSIAAILPCLCCESSHAHLWALLLLADTCVQHDTHTRSSGQRLRWHDQTSSLAPWLAHR